MKQEIWVENRKQEALDVPYYHVVFTMPDVLNRMCFWRPREMYEILFRSVAETLLQLGKDEKWLGGKIGFISVLHTWGSNLDLHPHLHVILVGCGIRHGKAIYPKKDDFLFPVKVMGKLFRGKFLSHMKEKDLEIPAGVYHNDWVVYTKETSSGEHIVSYLGRYTHRVAISDARILEVTDSHVAFSYKNYRAATVEEMTLTKQEFRRRFLMHVLPKGFRKIRFYGFLSNRNKGSMLKLLRRVLRSPERVNRFAGKTRSEIYTLLYGLPVCPCCGSRNVLRLPLRPSFHMIA